ncbi:MAG: tetratricopeptide repeat protein [Methanophagales archaeon]|nr:tetratricopeptide repeat protein [Methanophagales archaeon]MCW3136838.1 tetratricopeptide repeat protein [Methanophagales archaeon]MCW3139227.1 tetratricopeptide repeat protein [Methanophagales archaeon]MCW7070010.1 tetratricopeptide repeat protein [Methanophagales archaeon]MCW7073219.1 tetratricopeptide repeat protein [Methanophagales archaeon]
MEDKEEGEDIRGKTAEELLILGEECLADGRYEDAIKVYKEIVKREPIMPTLAKTCNDCGVAYANLEDYEMAIGFFNAALNLRDYLMDGGISTYYNLGQVYRLMGDEENADESFKRGDRIKQEQEERDEAARRVLSSV